MNDPFVLFTSHFKDYKIPTLATCTTVDKDKNPCTNIIDSKDFNIMELKLSIETGSLLAENIEYNNSICLLFYFEQSEPIQIRISAKSILESACLAQCNPLMFEFWIGNKVRLHKRYIYTLSKKDVWKMNMLYP